MRRPLNQNQRRDIKITVRVNQNEQENLVLNSNKHGLKIPGYLRSLGLNYSIKSIVDEKAAANLLKVNADMGRLGGLFKMWLEDNRADKHDFSNTRTYKDIDNLVNDIERLKLILKNEALKIMQKQA
ncbi:hypothetical protein LPB137_00540 [Poseidonibacter parvus]|uniref:Conjugal transfer protein TrbJ n=1 Tax=Poseidonibacter parvus TaxID=1850254 RepID=A0A1P8KIP9_9BACT|nr:hypothetical protein [Poseidonibacter parvus]APW64423.1 hypothetical protein LPB137_00540 [Poseidonibacter parvus]